MLDIVDDVLAAVRELDRRERRSIGDVISGLARQALTGCVEARAGKVAEPTALHGFEPLPSRGVVVTDEIVDRLREETGDGCVRCRTSTC